MTPAKIVLTDETTVRSLAPRMTVDVDEPVKFWTETELLVQAQDISKMELSPERLRLLDEAMLPLPSSDKMALSPTIVAPV